jgi:hypothetical protein
MHDISEIDSTRKGIACCSGSSREKREKIGNWKLEIDKIKLNKGGIALIVLIFF